jgi:hypothetical protein
MTKFVNVLIFAIAAVVASANGNFAQMPSAKPTFSLTLSARKTKVALGGDVLIEIRQTNLSNQTISCSAYAGSGVNYGFGYDVRDQHGAEAAKVVRSHPFVGSYHNCHLPPGQTITSGVLLNLIYQFDQTAEYIIQVSRPDARNPRAADVKSNTITISVLPEGEQPSAKPQAASH